MSELLFTTEEPPDWRALGWVDLGCTEEGLVWTGDMPRAMDTRELAARVRGDRPAGEPLWTVTYFLGTNRPDGPAFISVASRSSEGA